MSTIEIPGLGGSHVSVSLRVEFDGAACVDLAAFTNGRSPVVVSFASAVELIAALSEIQSAVDALPKPKRDRPIVFAGTEEAKEQYRATMAPFLRVIDGGKTRQPCAN